MNDDTLPEPLRDAVRALDRPPEPPREEMWRNIQAARHARRPERRSPHAWLKWTLPIAAALALGVALGRFTAPPAAEQPAFAEASPVAPAPGPALPYIVAAVQHLVRTDSLLTSLSEDVRTGQVVQASAWARDLLTNTRLLMDSPASADPQLAALLEDLELILAQIAALPTTPPATELRLIEDGIERTGVIGRLRAATYERPYAGT